MSPVKIQLESHILPLYEELVKHTQNGLSERASAAAHAILCAHPQVDDDLFLSRIISVAAQHSDLNIDAMSRLRTPGPKSAVQLYDIFARRFHFAAMSRFRQQILDAAGLGRLELLELACVSIRNLLIEAGMLGTTQRSWVEKRYPTVQRETLPAGRGIWLGAHATNKSLEHALNAIVTHSAAALDRIGLVLLAPGGVANEALIAQAKKFKNAVMVQYSSEDELIQGLRNLQMRVFIEMHGLQNPHSFIDHLRFGVANHQLTWAGLPESCPVPFIDGQLLDPVLAQASDTSCRAIPLHCWLPPAVSYPNMKRGDTYGIWAQGAKINENFMRFCSDLALKNHRRLQIYTGETYQTMAELPPHIELVSDFHQFQPCVLLDTSPMSGGNACLFALLNGIPAVTFPQSNISSRLGASILLNYGFPEGVVHSLEEYAAVATEFLTKKNLPHIPRQIVWEFADTIDRFFPA